MEEFGKDYLLLVILEDGCSVCMSLCKFMNMCAVPMEYSRGSKSLDLEFQVVVNCLTWMLRNELRSFTRTIYALNC